uniref:Uncharacterized protein n=1 Tax=Tanacetum cinerariifolium TaxID=118510 RepID=A0A6L2NEM4_TANCI|nr:hypothetical protein [Tanacetum cinerariifolium]
MRNRCGVRIHDNPQIFICRAAEDEDDSRPSLMRRTTIGIGVIGMFEMWRKIMLQRFSDKQSKTRQNKEQTGSAEKSRLKPDKVKAQSKSRKHQSEENTNFRDQNWQTIKLY